MTTRSVHQYVLGIYAKEGLTEEHVTKLQTGGPDGDLGSNEIKISKDKTIAIVDGSGVLYDPNGLDRPELLRLANARKMISDFDKGRLGPGGFRVLIGDHDVTLPDGTMLEDGMAFRNTFHLSPFACATIFVPCGGRPEAVNVNNVNELLPESGPRFRYIVEGANLFFTQHARMKLERAGVIIFKDASANKGGVTSSSLEVFSGLALTDTEFEQHMVVKGQQEPAFYSAYVADVQHIVENNAQLEFEAIWREHERTGTSRIDLADQLSSSITSMSFQLSSSKLWDNEALKRKVIAAYTPPSLLALLGLDLILERVPPAYLRAIFGAFLASRFVYTYGLDASPFAFFDFVQSYLA